jgi:hypothetical protein
MPRIADALERESQTVDLEHGGFERLLARRERKQRNRRIREGVLAVIVALAVGILLARSMTSANMPANPPDTLRLPGDPGAWQQIALPSEGAGCSVHGCLVRGIAAGDAGLVAMGSHFTCCGEAFVGWSSPDGLSWQQFEDGGARDAEAVVAAGPGFVAARHDDIITSTDGVSWEPARVSSDRGDQYLSVSAGGPGVVAVGSPSKAWFSSDGLTWEAATVPPTKSSAEMSKVAAGADRLVATGWTEAKGNSTDLVIWVSSDGMSWHDVPIDGDVFSSGCRITGLVGARAGFVATGWCGPVGDEGDYLVWRSDDGVNWSRVGGALDGRTPSYFGVSASPAGFIGTNSRIVWTSTDGESWNQLPTGAAFKNAEVLGVIAWGSRLVAVGDTQDDGNVVWISGPQR